MTHVGGRFVHGKCKNVCGCLFTTAFLFCFGLYALYKYTLIDADSVLMQYTKGDKGYFDYGDYGIDVSELRVVKPYKDADGHSISKVDQWDSIVKEDKGVRMGYITDNCGKILFYVVSQWSK